MINLNDIQGGVSHCYQDIFLSGNEDAYQVWREHKLAGSAQLNQASIVKLSSFSQPIRMERLQLLKQVEANNFAIYQLEKTESEKQLRSELISFCKSLGLFRPEINRSQARDGIVSIQVEESAIGAGYIPYSSKPLSWHTDGYYNASSKRIKGMVLHCVRDAFDGGANELFNHEIAYIRLRDANPSYITALQHHQAMTIPENKDQRSQYRPPSVGPVFFLDDITGRLQMRYSARGRNIIWRDDRDTMNARALLAEVMNNDPMIVRHKLLPGQGIISNNILHNRTRFTNREEEYSSSRLLYRIRYLDPVRNLKDTTNQGMLQGGSP